MSGLKFSVFLSLYLIGLFVFVFWSGAGVVGLLLYIAFTYVVYGLNQTLQNFWKRKG